MTDLRVVAVLKAKPGGASRLERALAAVLAPTRAEEGCISYELFRSTDDSTTLVTVEVWRCRDDFDQHMTTAHMNQMRELAGDAFEGRPDIHFLAAVTP